MQPQSADAYCLTFQLGRVSMISMPSEYLPRRVDWAKWMDCVSAGSQIFSDKISGSPRIALSPDHQDPKDNIAIASIQGQGGLETVDLLKWFSEIADATRFLFVGTWNQTIPSWFSSIQAVFNAQYGSLISDQLTTQMKQWMACAETTEKNGFFLVSDDLGRLSSLTSISHNWRARQIRSGVAVESRAPSWFASMIDVHRPNSSDGETVRLHRLAVFDPEDWCGSPKIKSDIVSAGQLLAEGSDLWISAPGVGLSLWIADQFHKLNSDIAKLRMPSSILGWHPLRDMIAFLGRAPSGSILYLVDHSARLHVLKKEVGLPL